MTVAPLDDTILCSIITQLSLLLSQHYIIQLLYASNPMSINRQNVLTAKNCHFLKGWMIKNTNQYHSCAIVRTWLLNIYQVALTYRVTQKFANRFQSRLIKKLLDHF